MRKTLKIRQSIVVYLKQPSGEPKQIKKRYTAKSEQNERGKTFGHDLKGNERYKTFGLDLNVFERSKTFGLRLNVFERSKTFGLHLNVFERSKTFWIAESARDGGCGDFLGLTWPH